MKTPKHSLPNELLEYERTKNHWTQSELADRLDVPDVRTIRRWENGEATPDVTYSRRLEQLFNKTIEQLGWATKETIPYHNIPPRNRFFTGRTAMLQQLDRLFPSMAVRQRTSDATLLPCALTGLGGIGKSQLALEYAYRYMWKYQIIVRLDARSLEILTSSFASIASLTNLSAKTLEDQQEVVKAVHKWLSQLSRWLLIFDSADNEEVIEHLADFIPSDCHGHALITSRLSSVGPLPIERIVEVREMELKEGVTFLLRRAKVINSTSSSNTASPQEYTIAKVITSDLEGLPLALDQAGAYIEDKKISLASYAKLYRDKFQQIKLLQTRGNYKGDYPDSVATTWLISFDRIQKANSAAIELVRFFSFLHPQTIPEKIITSGAPFLGPILSPIVVDLSALNEAIGELLRNSLIRRDSIAETFSVHSLVQAVVQDGMSEEVQRQWSERAVQAVSQVFLDPDTVSWTTAQQYLPNALVCVTWIEKWNFTCLEGTELLNNVGNYLRRIGDPWRAEPLHKRALAIREEVLGLEHPNTAINQSFLAACYNDQAKYDEAKHWAHQALAIQERVLGPEGLEVAITLIILGYAYHNLGQYKQAEQSFQRALAINEARLGSNHVEVALSLNDLGALYNDEALYMHETEKYKLAETCYLRSLEIRNRLLGSDHPLTASTLNNLGTLYNDLGQYEQAEQYLLQTLTIDKKAFGPDHSEVGLDLGNLAKAYKGQKKYELAENYAQQALAIYEKAARAKHPSAAYMLTELGDIYRLQHRYEEAESILQRALNIREQVLGIEHHLTIKTLNVLAELDLDRRKQMHE